MIRPTLIVFALVACAAAVAPPCASAQPSKRVLMIGIDGAGGRYVQRASTPNLDALASNGVARMDFLNEGALTVDPPEPFGASGVNWSTFLTGASAANHGVTDNSFTGARFDEHPHFFAHARAFDPTLNTLSLANWTPINTFITPDEFTDFEFGYETGTLAQQDGAVASDAELFLRFGDPDVMFLHFDHVDGAGHANSWGSPEHLAAIEAVDTLVGQVVGALNSRSGVASGEEDWLILISADHGAAEGAFGHVASQGLPNWEVPFIASGPSVDPGTPLSQGTLRDLAATALWHLGVDPFEAGLDGTVRGLTIAPPSGVVGDFNGDGLFQGDGSGPAATDDVSVFLNNWLSEGTGAIPVRYARGDINLDGRTDLSDWAMVNRLNPAMGQAIANQLTGVPEPSSACLIALAALMTSRPTRSAQDLRTGQVLCAG